MDFRVTCSTSFYNRPFYSEYLSVFEDGLPRAVKDKSGKVLDFIGIIAKCYDKFKKSQELTSLLKLLTDKP